MSFANKLSARIQDSLAGCVDFCVLHARAVVVSAFLVAAAALGTTTLFLSVNTNLSGMIDPDLDFRKRYEEFARLFPQLDRTLIAVVDAETSELATEAARSLVTSFETRPDLFTDVYAPGVDTFFDSHGMLYLSEAELNQVATQLQAGLPLIAALSNDQTMRGLVTVFQGLGSQLQQGATLANFLPFLDELNRVFLAHSQGRRDDLDWESFLAAGSSERSGTRRFVFIKPVLNFQSLAPAEEAMQEAQQLANDPETNFSGAVQIRFTGDIALSAEEMRSVTDSSILAGIISLVLVSVVLTFGVRSWRLVAASILTLVIGLLCTAGFATIAIGYLNLISVAFAVLFLGLGIDFAIHFALRYEEETKRGRPLRLALSNTSIGVGGALAMCTGAAAMGFLAFTPTSFHGMAQLGIISAAGMLIAFICSLTVLPALLSLMPLTPTFDGDKRHAKAPQIRLLRHWRLWATGATMLACIVAVFFLSQVRFDGDPVALKDPETPSVQAFLELFENGATSPYIIQLIVDDEAAIASAVQDLTALDDVRGVVSALTFLPLGQERKLPVVQTLRLGMERVNLREPTDIGTEARTQALATIQGYIQQFVSAADDQSAPAALRLAESLQLYIQSSAGDPARDAELEYAIFRKLPGVVDRINTSVSGTEVTLETLPDSIRNRYISADGKFRLEVLPSQNLSDETQLRTFVNAVLAVAPRATGTTVEIVKSSDVVVESMFIATGVAGVLIFVVLLIALRSIIGVLLVFLPIILSGILTLAATVWFGIAFNFANVIVLPLLIGLGVAGGVHLVVRVLSGNGTENFMETNTPRAVLLSALTTIGSFASLSISSHQGLASMGLLLTIAISFTLLSTLVVLPTVISFLTRPVPERPESSYGE